MIDALDNIPSNDGRCVPVSQYKSDESLLKLGTHRYGQYLDPFGQIWAISNSSSSTICDVPEHLARKIIPLISVDDAAAYMDFLSKAFDAEEAYPALKDPTGKVSRHSARTPLFPHNTKAILVLVGDYVKPSFRKLKIPSSVTGKNYGLPLR